MSEPTIAEAKALTPYWADDWTTLYLGDAREVLRSLPAESVHCCICSPPYWGLRDYGLPPVVWDAPADGCEHEWGETGPAHHPGQVRDSKAVTDENAIGQNAGSGSFCLRCSAWLGTLGLEPTPELYVQHIMECFREVRRVLRADATCWLNMGDGYWGGKGNNASSKARRTAEERGYQQSDGTVLMDTLPADGKHPLLKPKDLLGMPWRVAFALQADGWWLRSAITWCKGSPMPESVRDRPTSATEMMFLLTKSSRYFYDLEATRILSNSLNPSNGVKKAGLEFGASAPRRFSSEGSKVSLNDHWTPYLVLAALLSAKRILVKERHDLFGQLFDALKTPGQARIGWPRLAAILKEHASKLLMDVFENIGIIIAQDNLDAQPELWTVTVTMPQDDRSLAVKQSGEVVAKLIRNSQRIRQAIPLDSLTEGLIDVYSVDEAVAFFEGANFDAGGFSDSVITEARLEQLTLALSNFTTDKAGTRVTHTDTIIPSSRNLWNWWLINPQPFPDAHFATFPEDLVKPCIQAGTSERGCCPECGAQWERVVDRSYRVRVRKGSNTSAAASAEAGHGPHGTTSTIVTGTKVVPQTLGWRPTCTHGGEPIPAVVCDPFSGSGTVGVVARKAGRRSILIDLKAEYLEMARERCAQGVLL